MSTNLIGIADAAKALAVSPFTVRRLIAAGEIKAVNVGARRLIPVSEVDRVGTHGAGRPRQRMTKQEGSRA
jgi:excisionase family DNA binding protein